MTPLPGSRQDCLLRQFFGVEKEGMERQRWIFDSDVYPHRCHTNNKSDVDACMRRRICLRPSVPFGRFFTNVFFLPPTLRVLFSSCFFPTRPTPTRYLPGGLQSSVMNIFRLPLNVLVVVGTRVTDIAQPETVFLMIASWFVTSAVLQLRLSAHASRDEQTKKAKSD